MGGAVAAAAAIPAATSVALTTAAADVTPSGSGESLRGCDRKSRPLEREGGGKVEEEGGRGKRSRG